MKKAAFIFTLFVILVTATYGQVLNYYYGNLHSHSGYSDGNKDSSSTLVSKPAGDYSFAKASLHFDFLGISEHNHFSSNNNPGMIRTSYGLGLAQAAAANQDGTFLCLYGMEWGVSTTTGSGHVIIYGFNQLIGWEPSAPGLSGPNYDIFVDKTDYFGLFRLIKNTPNSFCYLAHPWWSDFQNLSNLSYNSMIDSAIVGIPFRSGLAMSTFTNYSDYPSGDYFQYYQKMLSLGYHIGIGYDHDNHNLTFGRNNAGRLVIMAPALTQADLYYAMKNMHFYASDDWNAKLDFKIGSKTMGDSTSGLTPPTISFVHNDDDGEIADTIRLWSGTEGSLAYSTVLTKVSGNNTLSFTDNAMAPGTNKYYFIEVIQPDGDRIVSSPIWYRLSNFAGVNELQNNISVVAFPNPVNSVLYLSTDLKEPFAIEISNANGQVVSEQVSTSPDAKISTAKFAKGFYYLKITSGNKSKVQKIIIE